MAGNSAYYKDFREHLNALEKRGKLVRISRDINKDTELMPLVRWQFRGLDERERKAFIFENVIDSKGRRYNMPVTVGTLAATTEIYAIGLMCEPEQIHERWTQAQLQPIEPVEVATRAGTGGSLAGTGFAERPWPRHDPRADFHAGLR